MPWESTGPLSIVILWIGRAVWWSTAGRSWVCFNATEIILRARNASGILLVVSRPECAPIVVATKRNVRDHAKIILFSGPDCGDRVPPGSFTRKIPLFHGNILRRCDAAHRPSVHGR